jgi:hypothetical protein
MASPTKYFQHEIIHEDCKRLIAWPDESSQNVIVEEAIFLDAYEPILILFEHASEEFRKTLINALWEKGLIRQEDFFLPNAHKLLKQALNAALKHDVLSILQSLKE